MKKFIFHWLDGSQNEGYGDNVSQAFANAGFGRGAVPALDYYEEVKEDNESIDIKSMNEETREATGGEIIKRVVLLDEYTHDGKKYSDLVLSENSNGDIELHNGRGDLITTVHTIHGLSTALQCLYSGLKI